MFTFNIEGQAVVCYQTGADRLWRCECAYFQRTFATHNQGFCPYRGRRRARTARRLLDVGRHGSSPLN